MTRTLIVALMLGGATTAPAQQSPLVGTWKVSYIAGMMIENGIQTPLHATGTLELLAQGDSLVGTLTMDPTPDMPARPPSRLAGKATAGEVTLVSHTKAVLSRNGEEFEANAVSTWTLSAKGDSLSGGLQRSIEGADMPPMPQQSVSGTRKKS